MCLLCVELFIQFSFLLKLVTTNSLSVVMGDIPRKEVNKMHVLFFFMNHELSLSTSS